MEDMKTIYFIPLHQCGGKTRFWNKKNMEIAVRVLGGVHELFYPPPPSEFKKKTKHTVPASCKLDLQSRENFKFILGPGLSQKYLFNRKKAWIFRSFRHSQLRPNISFSAQNRKKTTTCQCNQLVGGNCCYFDVLFGDPRNFRWNGKSVGEMSRLVHHQH